MFPRQFCRTFAKRAYPTKRSNFEALGVCTACEQKNFVKSMNYILNCANTEYLRIMHKSIDSKLKLAGVQIKSIPQRNYNGLPRIFSPIDSLLHTGDKPT